MAKIRIILLIVCIMAAFIAGYAAKPQPVNSTTPSTITLQIGNPLMSVADMEKEIDPGRGTVPIIEDGRTLLPIRAVVEAMGGTVAWDEETQTTVLAKEDTILLLTAGSPTAFFNETPFSLDAVPTVVNDRTMLPIRFVAEGFGYAVGWDSETQTVTLSYESETEHTAATADTVAQTVNMTLADNIVTVANAPDNSTLITAFYKNEALQDVTLYKGSGTITANLSQGMANADLAKIFLWDMGRLYPLSEKTVEISSANPGNFNFETKTVQLNSGYEMPIMGLGTYSLSDEECYNSVTALLEAGGRLIDTAYIYGNEAAVGRALRDSDVPREEIFVITKLYPNQFANPEQAIDQAMEKLDIGYIDLMLLHHPGTGDVEAYKAMEQAVADGKIRSIGLSNWYVEELEEFLPQVDITPALVQNEIHPYYQENDVIPYIQEKGIVVQGWYPFGGRGHTAELLGDATISAIAEAHGVTSAQVILRWNLQKGVVVIPGSSNPDHIRENLDLFGFALTADEMRQINALDRGEKHDWY